MKFALRFSRDFFGAMIIVQLVIWLFTLIVWACDRKSTLLYIFPKTWPQVGIYYIWGLFAFSLLAATYGAIFLLYKCTCGKNYSGRSYSYFDYPYGMGPYFMRWYYPSGYSCAPMGCCHYGGGGGWGSGSGSGSCSGGCGDCGGSSDNDGGGLAIAALIIMIVAIAIGVIVMVVIATVIFRRHAHVLHRRAEAQEQEVVNLAEYSEVQVPMGVA